MECSARWRHLWQRAGRRKPVEPTDTHTALRRCLTTLQMTAIGLGSTIGVGIYVLLGVAIRDYAGPGVVLSFLVAGVVVLTNAVIFAEFGSHIPHTGASYTYVYCTVGEMAAFLTGWMALLSTTCSAATGARAWSGFVDSLFNNTIRHYLDAHIGHVDLGPPFARSLDLPAFAFFLLVTAIVSCNVRCSAAVNGFLAVLTTAVLVFVSVAGPIMGDVSRLADASTGGFLPYGLSGVVTGASAAFFAFNGYDSICIAAEEARDPVRSVPRAILLELLIVTVVYCGASVGTACLVPYRLIDLRAPIPSAFAYQGADWARYVATVGPVLAISNLSILSLYSLSRIAYRMSCDGLLLKCFQYVHPRTKVPLGGVIFFGGLVSLVSLLLELRDLVRFSVLCMLFQYILLAPAFIALRAGTPPKSACVAADNDDDENATAAAAPVGTDASLRRSGNDGCAMDELNMEIVVDCEEPLTSSAAEQRSSRLRVSRQSSERRSSASSLHTPLVNAEVRPEGSDSGGGGSPGLAEPSRRPAAAVAAAPYSYVTSGDLGSGALQPAPNGDGGRLLREASGSSVASRGSINNSDVGNTSVGSQRHGDAAEQRNGVPAAKQGALAEAPAPAPASWEARACSGEDGALAQTHDPAGWEAKTSDFADESHTSEAEPVRGTSLERASPWTRTKAEEKAENSGCFENTARVFFRLLTTRRCLALLVSLLAALAAQLGLGWEDVRRASWLAVASTALLTALIIFLCEVLRKRCGPGNHQGFKVPLVPYLPALSCFLNMLLLVSAADMTGVVEFGVLVFLGLVAYVVLMMTRPLSNESNGRTTSLIVTEESYALLGQDDNDADSEGSS